MLSRRRSMRIGRDFTSTIATIPASSSNPRTRPGGGLAAVDVQTVESTFGNATTRACPPARGILRKSASGPTNVEATVWTAAGGGGFASDRLQARSAIDKQRSARTQKEGQRDQVQNRRRPGASRGTA